MSNPALTPLPTVRRLVPYGELRHHVVRDRHEVLRDEIRASVERVRAERAKIEQKRKELIGAHCPSRRDMATLHRAWMQADDWLTALDAALTDAPKAGLDNAISDAGGE